MQFIDIIIYILFVVLYYLFLKTALEVFTYKELRSYSILAISIAEVVVSLGINLFLGVLMLFTVLKLLKLNLKEAFVVAFTAEFGFLLGIIVVMFILTTAGTMFGIEGLEFNMTWDELLRIAGYR
ncbi:MULTISPECIES: hypothetical protein [Thermococcus]|uniref:Uncharacterized protein n=2 Tax=Thermococcus sibiricus TaxID=172049 RepID=C6A0J7_THESM|nr:MULTISPECIES: hypothetical protein [Thermococcus]ACS89142.1 hypothetical protein TSIB_0074 [Thermococcus sibiricus MM 739]KUK17831.1 MAG: Uncharacterized protein XD54_0848 [Thermococcus sibiricus]MBC7095333.1 hypothetical protein [Thermococcus sp.]